MYLLRVTGTLLSSEDKGEVLRNIWKPTLQFAFPSSGKRNLKFQLSWLGRYEWLAYSKIQDGAYCTWCTFFVPTTGVGVGDQKPGQLVNTPFQNWKKAKETFDAHQKKKYHENCAISAAAFMKVTRGEQQPIDEEVASSSKEKQREQVNFTSC